MTQPEESPVSFRQPGETDAEWAVRRQVIIDELAALITETHRAKLLAGDNETLGNISEVMGFVSGYEDTPADGDEPLDAGAEAMLQRLLAGAHEHEEALNRGDPQAIFDAAEAIALQDMLPPQDPFLS